MSSCFICDSIDANLCPVCGQLSYCTLHANLHKNDRECFPYKIGHHKLKGRILEAIRDVDMGELLFEETPLLTGPSKISDPVCLVCLANIQEDTNTGVNCENCSYPMCSDSCAIHHVQLPECAILCKHVPHNQLGMPDYQAIFPLRCLLSKNTSVWDYIQMFEDHCGERQLTQAWSEDRVNVVGQIRNRWDQKQWTEQEIFRIEGILDVNTLEYNCSEGTTNSSRAFYPITSFGSHDCVNNTFRRHKPNQGDKVVLETRAKSSIKKGQEITLHYAGGLKGRLLRRSLLAEGWFFGCQCRRCKSPTELGSHMSSLRCHFCGDGILLPKCDISAPQEEYECDTCSGALLGTEVAEIERQYSTDIEATCTDDVEALEALLEKHSNKFHPRHYLNLIVKWILINLYGRKQGLRNHELCQARLENKATYCREYLEAMDIVDPGISHNRGRTLWELYSVEAFMLQQKKDAIGKDEYVKGLHKLSDLLNETIMCLGYYDQPFEVQVCQIARKALGNCREVLQFAHMI